MAGMNDAVDWSHRPRRRDDASRWSRRARSARMRATLLGPGAAGSCGRLVAAEIELDENRPAPGAQLPARRDAGRPRARRDRHRRADGRQDHGDARLRRRRPIVPAMRNGRLRPGDGRRRRDEPPPLRPCGRPPARATARGRSRGPGSSPSAPSGRSRSATTRGSWPRTTSRSSGSSRDWGAEGWADGERELLPGVSVIRTGGHSAGHQAIVVRGTGRRRPDARVLRRPVHAAVERQPALGDRVRRLPARLASRSRASCSRARPRRTGSWRSRTSRGCRSARWCRTATGSGSRASRAARARVLAGATPRCGRSRVLVRQRPVDDLDDLAVGRDEELRRQGVHLVQVEDVGGRVERDPVAQLVLARRRRGRRPRSSPGR